jgi:hypothetical protein
MPCCTVQLRSSCVGAQAVGAVIGSEFEPRRPRSHCNTPMLFSWIALSKIQPDAYVTIGSNDFVEVRRNPGFFEATRYYE